MAQRGFIRIDEAERKRWTRRDQCGANRHRQQQRAQAWNGLRRAGRTGVRRPK
ncbi:hypothetical protein [Paraburkholderia youngii]|uniref:hypothetical protein n=1 Tax=Paraburkholderia youngii TaxID=2782701 RepID=UPI0020CDCE0D|nr:hypothetical protein [Paraburkholderia youngii]